MYKVTMPVGDDPHRVFFTCDTLEEATSNALVLSRSTRRWTDNLDLCWVDIRDVKNVVIKSVNFWKLNETKKR